VPSTRFMVRTGSSLRTPAGKCILLPPVRMPLEGVNKPEFGRSTVQPYPRRFADHTALGVIRSVPRALSVIALVYGVLLGWSHPLPLRAQENTKLNDTLRRIFASPEFAGKRFGPARWLKDGYVSIEPSAMMYYLRFVVCKGLRASHRWPKIAKLINLPA